ncbi:anion permease [uncultured Mitsuokella sp.]|nr:anion permease [uncultured Mitsuokella sp.]
MNQLQRGLLTIGLLIILWFIPVPEGLSLKAWHLFAVLPPSSPASS